MSTPAIDVVTIGESLVSVLPITNGTLQYAPLLTRAVAGAESNVAITLSRLGLKTRWISRLGTDPFGDVILGTLLGEGVDTSCVVREANAPTAIMFRENRGYGDPNVWYYRRGSAASKFSPQDVQPSWFENARHLHVTGITPALGENTFEMLVEAMQQARTAGLTISFDPNVRRKLWDESTLWHESTAREKLLHLTTLCDIVLPGLDEAQWLLNTNNRDEMASQFLQRGASLVVFKLGEQGTSAFTASGQFDVPAYPIERVIDSVGAGDAFAAGLLSVLLAEDKVLWASRDVLERALRRASLMGALATQFAGDWEALPRRKEVERLEAGMNLVSR
jgi:2-dehydro-3-deoxygluconokinase